MVEVTPMLRQLFTSIGARPMSEVESARQPVAKLSDKLERRQRQIEFGRLPKSVCTSLRDICEM